MTPEQIEQWARETRLWLGFDGDYLGRCAAFAELVAAHEREECALLAEAAFRFAKDGYEIADEIRLRCAK